ncbi:2-oxoacid:ferredoxin oxidoreductase, gamma subunit [Mesotoga prima MesG1.Ag.4.2]|jgi:2-oxoglutarate ferredoxin oxidoreductase subunit gamma|uniref:2-oxoacid:ferredoxin oxidoreductase, gamma subunit n=1 Tax=Mesotoga prima MesG1.Ag.4.2 TaxID=660470 RepID=I2F3Q0_9BACT|nr:MULTISPECIES: 2-oxoacid:acceptor oxidoreductase family protein [Mesotoga]AFK06553.1 2-oxoacid:ferredoxin oxidoreductase, gamma subunit [Mesotoga prima MesG1.Ag.4.2]PIJ62352.1 pyruvate ferredoxin oxidoreductase [Mesotoga sp. H07.pep.5.3]
MKQAFTQPHSVRISGIGGQGNVLMGIILAEALIIQGNWVVQTQSYGAQVRGGLSYCDVLFNSEPIDYPKAHSFELIYSMHQTAVNAHVPLLHVNGVLIVDSTLVSSIPKEGVRMTRKIIQKPVTELTEKKFGSTLPANMVGLGLIARAGSFVTTQSLKEAMTKHIKAKYVEMNAQAIDFGYSLIEKSYSIRRERIDSVGRGFE